LVEEERGEILMTGGGQNINYLYVWFKTWKGGEKF
jgi:hypothetical protein